MSREIIPKLENLPPLKRTSRGATCKICGASAVLFDVVDFNKYCSSGNPFEFGVAGLPVCYFRCNACEFVFSDLIDLWTHEEIGRFIYNDDYVLVDPEYKEARPKHVAAIMSKEMQGLQECFILDYGSGSGVFAAEMARYGFCHVSCYDPYSSPSRPQSKFDIVTCFEVIEHSADPKEILQDIEKFLNPNGIILIGQTIQPTNIEDIRGAWWYIGPRNGHVSTFSNYTFSTLARQMGYDFRLGSALYEFHKCGAELANEVKSLVEKVGPRFFGCVLLAPREASSALREWHHLEHCRTIPFRWTAASTIDFGKFHIDCDIANFKIPFLMEITPGFAQHCTVQLDGVDIHTSVEGSNLIGTVRSLAPRHYQVTIKLPQLLTPKMVNGALDDRPLGLAVRAESDRYS